MAKYGDAMQKLSLYPLLLREQRGHLMTSLVPTMLAISHGIEDTVVHNRLRGTFYAGFQRFSAFLPQLNRFARLASICGKVFVFGVPDAPVPDIPNIHLLPLNEDAPLAEEWFIVFAHPEFAVSLVTQQTHTDIDPSAFLFGRGRSYRGAVTFDPQSVVVLDTCLAEVLGQPPQTAVLDDLAPPAQPYHTFFQVFSETLEGRNRQLASLYNTITERNASLERLQAIVQTMMSRAAWEEASAISDQAMPSAASVEQKTLTILTTDIQGFTTLSETLSAASLIGDLNRYLDLLATTVYQCNGDVDKFLGDGMLAFFAQPADALRAALRIQKRLKAFNEQQITARRVPLPTRVALTTGLCIIARVGSRDRQEVTVMGDIVNTSSRLQSLGETGWVLMDEATFLACEQPATIPTMLKVRGKQGLQPVYQVLPESFDAVLHHLDAAF